ncbi:astacin-like metalloendopeptidase [Lepidochelys kempii]|uniref:astacin-like metalloendopeptidase n=1 Tax=Lepidochelys kempii TaxID=8472 RepID=UPI003C6FDB6F
MGILLLPELIPPEAPESSFLLEGDIIKVSPFRVFSSASPKWPKRRGTVQIPYIISYKYDKPSVKILKEAFADFAKFTCVKFVPYSYQRDFVSIMPMAGCFSSVGRTGGMQVVSLAPACLRRGKGVTLHELMHVVGFWHEHSRADRDKYISISWNEILTGFEINFMKSWNSNMLVNYDYSSVLHYGRYAFSMTGLPTIIPLSDPHVALGQRWNLSSSDIARVNKLYKCSPTLTEPAVQAPASPAMDKPIAAPPQSGSGKHAHQNLPAQKATVPPGWQVCDFEKDLCSWQQSDTDDFDWILAGERPSARTAIGNLSEETHYSPSRGKARIARESSLLYEGWKCSALHLAIGPQGPK